MNKLGDLVKKHSDIVYLVFRALVGVMFFLHGYDKLFVKGMELASLMGLAGIIEAVVGLAVLLGIFVRPAALLGAVTMLVAYFKVHASKGLSPLANGGELALMYLAAFLVLMIYGAYKWSLEEKLLKKEMF